MAFNAKNFVLCSKTPLFKNEASLWLYTTQDTLEACLGDNYFKPRSNLKNQDSPKVGDIIQCIVSGSNIAYLKITAKTEKPYNITVARTFLENEAVIIAQLANKADKTTDFATPITEENLGITQAEQTELENKIDLAANSGRMITAQGFWYAKMYSETVAPSAEDGTNYADFSQTDQDDNPIIVTYVRESGAWVQDQTITPPADYDGYVPITSKIWDIVEQDGQQGGRVLWNHVSKEFTPYPTIIAFDSIQITGDSTVVMPADPDDDNIANVGFVIDHCASRNVGDIFFTSRTDSVLNGAVPCDGTTYQTTDYTGAQAPSVLLQGGKLPYVSLAQYATLLATNGSVGVFGWDGIGTTAFKVPTLTDIFLETGTAAQAGDYVAPSLPNITGGVNIIGRFSNVLHGFGNATGAFSVELSSDTGQDNCIQDGSPDYKKPTLKLDASTVSSVYNNSTTTVQPQAVRYRAMIQLYSAAGDQSLAELATVAYTGDYNDLNNKPTIPTKTSDLQNDSGFISNLTQADVTTALGYTPYNSSNPNGYQANVLEGVKVNGVAQTISNKAVDITIGNGTITLTQGGVTKGSFTTNQGGNTTIALDAGGTIPTSPDVTTVGTLTQTGSVFSGFSSSNYLTLPAPVDFRKPFEFVIGAKFTAGTLNQAIAFMPVSYFGSFLLLYKGSTSELEFIAVGGTVTISGVVSTGIDYLIKVSWSGTEYKMFVSTDDGDTYTQIGSTVSNTSHCGYGNVFAIGKTFDSQYYEDYLGTIDIANAYLKIDENLTWTGLDVAGLQQRVAKGHEVIEFQTPTSTNNYTWYRKYADGWVEQGGECAVDYNGQSVSFPVTMKDARYHFFLSIGQGQLTGTVGAVVDNRTTTGMTVFANYSATTPPDYICWEIKGMWQ